MDRIIERIEDLIKLSDRLAQVQQVGYCYWFETFGKQFSLHITPLTIADKFQLQLEKQQAAWIFTSATLDSGDNFSHFAAELGIINAQKKILHSPSIMKNKLYSVFRVICRQATVAIRYNN